MKIKGISNEELDEDLLRFKNDLKKCFECQSLLLKNITFKNYIKIFPEDFLFAKNLIATEHFNGVKFISEDNNSRINDELFIVYQYPLEVAEFHIVISP